ncbi:MAG: CsiV family protein [Pseudomonadales bacterium]
MSAGPIRTAAQRPALALLWLATLLPGPSAAVEAEAPTDLLAQAWYYTEVVVFERPQIMDHASDEALARAPATLPADLRWLAPDAPGGQPGRPSRGYDLYPVTQAYLAFPYLDRSLLPESVTASDGFSDPRFGDARYGEARAADEPDDGQDDGADASRRPVPTIEPRLAPDPLLDFLRELAAFEASLEEASYRWLAPETFTLNSEANRLERRGGYRVLLHGRWLQPVPARDAPEPLLFRVGPRFGDAHALEGTFDVTVGRYLHFHARIYYTEPLLGRTPIDRPQSEDPAAVPPARLAFDPAGVMQLSESRRLRSDELHYLDHPKLGVLVRMTPAQPPEALSAAFAALQIDGSEKPTQ